MIKVRQKGQHRLPEGTGGIRLIRPAPRTMPPPGESTRHFPAIGTTAGSDPPPSASGAPSPSLAGASVATASTASAGSDRSRPRSVSRFDPVSTALDSAIPAPPFSTLPGAQFHMNESGPNPSAPE